MEIFNKSVEMNQDVKVSEKISYVKNLLHFFFNQMSKEDERIVLEHCKAGESKAAITRELNANPDSPHLSYEQVKTIWRNYVLRDAKPTPSAPRRRPSDHKIDEEIVKCLDETPTASVRQIADTINVPKSTVYRHLTEDLGYKFRNVRWIPHFLNESQKQQRVIQSKALLDLLHRHDRDKWRFIFTGDESWFQSDNQTQKIWVPENDPRPEFERPNIMTKKIMVCFFGIHMVFLPFTQWNEEKQ